MKLILTIFTFFFMITAGAQDLSSHQWQDRVLLVITDDISNVIFKKQLAELKQNKDKLKELKLVIYQVKQNSFRKGLDNGKWQTGSQIFNEFIKPPSTFRIVLLGLDGGEKLNQAEFLTAEQLFAVIDVMPMRKAEIRKKGR